MLDNEIKHRLWDVYMELKRKYDFNLGCLFIKISKRLRSAAGNCRSNTRLDIYTITMSKPLLDEFGWERFEKNFRHELAHAYCEKTYGRCGHNHTFKRTCVDFGGSMNTRMAGYRYKEAGTTEYVKTIKKYKYTCNKCGKSMEYAKRMSSKVRNSQKHKCRTCHNPISNWTEEMV